MAGNNEAPASSGDIRSLEKSLDQLSKSLKETNKEIREEGKRRTEAVSPNKASKQPSESRQDIVKSINFFSEKVNKLAKTSDALKDAIKDTRASKASPEDFLAKIRAKTPGYESFQGAGEAKYAARVKEANDKLAELQEERASVIKLQKELQSLIKLQEKQLNSPGLNNPNKSFGKFSALGESVTPSIQAQMFLQANMISKAMSDLGTPRGNIERQIKEIQDKIDRNMDLAFAGASTGKDEKGRFRRLTTLAMNDARQLMEVQKLKSKQDSDYKKLKDRVDKDRTQFGGILDSLYGPAVNPKMKTREDLLRKVEGTLEDLSDNIDEMNTNLEEAKLNEKIAGLRRKTEHSWLLNPRAMLSETISKYKNKAIASVLGGIGRATGLSALSNKSELMKAQMEEEQFSETRQERQAGKRIRARQRDVDREKERMGGTAHELEEDVVNIEEVNDELRDKKKKFEDVYATIGLTGGLDKLVPGAKAVDTKGYWKKINDLNSKISGTESGLAADDAKREAKEAEDVQVKIKEGIWTLVDIDKKKKDVEVRGGGEAKVSSGMGLTALALGLIRGIAGYEAAKVAQLWTYASKIPGMARLATPIKNLMASKFGPAVAGGREIFGAAKTGIGGVARLGGMGLKAVMGASGASRVIGMGANIAGKAGSILGTAGKIAGGVAKVMPILDVLGLGYGAYKGATMDEASKQAEIDRLREAQSTVSGALWEATKTFFNPVQQGKNIAIAAREGGGLISQLFKNHADSVNNMKKTTALKERQIQHLQDMGASDTDISGLRGAMLDNDDLFQKKYREILLKNKGAQDIIKAEAVPPTTARDIERASDLGDTAKAAEAIKTSSDKDRAVADAMNRGFEMVATTIVKNKPVITTIVSKGPPPRDTRFPMMASALPSGASLC